LDGRQRAELKLVLPFPMRVILLNDFSPDFGKFLFSTESSPDRELMLKILRTVVFGAVAGTETFRDVGARGAAYVARAWSFQ
jgi:hypothetical protein